MENIAKETERKFQVVEQELKFFKLQEKKAQKKVIEKNEKIVELDGRSKDAKDKIQSLEQELHLYKCQATDAKRMLEKNTQKMLKMETACKVVNPKLQNYENHEEELTLWKPQAKFPEQTFFKRLIYREPIALPTYRQQITFHSYPTQKHQNLLQNQ